MKNSINVGDKFGQLTIIEPISIVEASGVRRKAFICQCECGNTKTVRKSSLTCKNPQRSCGCMMGNLQLSQNEWIALANEVHDHKYLYTKAIYTGGKNKVIITCSIHGDFEQKASNHLYLGRGCPKCNGGIPITLEEWKIKCQEEHNNFYDYSKSELTGIKNSILIICPLHGEFWQKAENHYVSGCPACAGNKPISLKDFLKRIILIHGNKYDYSLVEEICGVHSKIKIICHKHGIFEQTIKNHLCHKQGCKHCSIGNTSNKEQVWLDLCGVPNNQEYRNVIIWVGNKKFCVDGFYKNEKIIYEFLGDFWHGHPIRFSPDKINPIIKKKFSELFTNTVQKIRFLRDNGYKVICIWEYDFDRKCKNETKNISNC